MHGVVFRKSLSTRIWNEKRAAGTLLKMRRLGFPYLFLYFRLLFSTLINDARRKE